MKKIAIAFFMFLVLFSGSISAKPWGDDKVNFMMGAGWCGLGPNIVSGFQATDDAYGTRPWFNSWHLEVDFDIINQSSLKVYAGVGYESSVFLFNKPYVFVNTVDYIPASFDYYDSETLKENGEYMLEGIYETRLVTRYINLAVGAEYYLTDELSVGCAVIPGINFTSRHTGLRYEMDGFDTFEGDDMSDLIEPVKFDCRLYVQYSCFGVFFQLPVMPLFKNMNSDRYPIKAGLFLKF